MAKPPGKCIFCGRGRLTKEHIFPEWIQGVLPKRFAAAAFTVGRPNYPNIPQVGVHSSYRPTYDGDPLSRKLYVVCKDCNTGWMARLQELSKATVKPLLLGDWSGLSAENQQVVAAWATMTTMVLEFTDPPTAAAPQADRKYFMDNQRPPDGWQIWMGKYRGMQDRSFLHTAFFRLLENVPPNVPENPKGHVTTIRIGQLLLSLLLTPRGVTVTLDQRFMVANGIAPIWPPNGHVARTLRTLDDDGANHIHRFMRGIFDY